MPRSVKWLFTRHPYLSGFQAVFTHGDNAPHRPLHRHRWSLLARSGFHNLKKELFRWHYTFIQLNVYSHFSNHHDLLHTLHPQLNINATFYLFIRSLNNPIPLFTLCFQIKVYQELINFFIFNWHIISTTTICFTLHILLWCIGNLQFHFIRHGIKNTVLKYNRKSNTSVIINKVSIRKKNVWAPHLTYWQLLSQVEVRATSLLKQRIKWVVIWLTESLIRLCYNIFICNNSTIKTMSCVFFIFIWSL